jgi:probable F420-dependent oxidoreductase
MTRTFKVGVQLQPQFTTIKRIRAAWRAADTLGVDSVWLWDHLVPLGPGGGPRFEAWTLLAAACTDTTHARIGPLASCTAFRNPDLTADMARTLHQLSGGRFVLGVGAGWSREDFDEYGFRWQDPGPRLAAFADDVDRIVDRLPRLNPAPRRMPLLVAGAGPRITLRVAARHAALWNMMGPPDRYAQRNQRLDRWCTELGREPGEIERTVLLPASDLTGDRLPARCRAYLSAGARHLIVSIGEPFDLSCVERLLRLAEHEPLPEPLVTDAKESLDAH